MTNSSCAVVVQDIHSLPRKGRTQVHTRTARRRPASPSVKTTTNLESTSLQTDEIVKVRAATERLVAARVHPHFAAVCTGGSLFSFSDQTSAISIRSTNIFRSASLRIMSFACGTWIPLPIPRISRFPSTAHLRRDLTLEANYVGTSASHLIPRNGGNCYP